MVQPPASRGRVQAPSLVYCYSVGDSRVGCPLAGLAPGPAEGEQGSVDEVGEGEIGSLQQQVLPGQPELALQLHQPQSLPLPAAEAGPSRGAGGEAGEGGGGVQLVGAAAGLGIPQPHLVTAVVTFEKG